MSLTARQRSIHNKNGTKRSTSFKAKRTRKGSEGEFLVTSAPTDQRSVAYPGGAAALAILLTARITSALWGQIHDCDETYNYWEPLHYLVYGSGLQTWEYSPAYAIRSYLPLWLFAVPAKILSYVMSPVSIFYTIRVTLAVLTAFAELMFYKAVCQEWGVAVARGWLAAAAAAAGGGAAAGALLPAAHSHALLAAALAASWRRRPAAAVLLVAVSALLSWPFTALLGVPIAIDLVFVRGSWRLFLRWSLIGAAATLLPSLLLDSLHYGRLVLAPWNIVRYNLLSKHGPELYGVEPWTYYLVNGFLNFNIVWLSSLVTPALLLGCWLLRCGSRPGFTTPAWLALAPLYLWLAVFMLQPHKEERFLYPVYSMIVLCGLISLDCVQRLVFAATELCGGRRAGQRRHYLTCTRWLARLFLTVAVLAGISRSVALYRNYSAPMSVLSPLPPLSPPPSSPLSVCWGREWYRSPSSFHLPAHYRMRFIQSEFKGQMPAPYAEQSNGTQLIPPYFNDANIGDNSTYLPVSHCHYLVESGDASHLPGRWTILRSLPLLDAAASQPIARAFYLPFVSDRYLNFTQLHLLRNDDLVA